MIITNKELMLPVPVKVLDHNLSTPSVVSANDNCCLLLLWSLFTCPLSSSLTGGSVVERWVVLIGLVVDSTEYICNLLCLLWRIV